MSTDEDVAAYSITSAKNANGKKLLIEEFFITKLGTTSGKRMFKEFADFAATAVQSAPGVAGVVFDDKGGHVVSINSLR